MSERIAWDEAEEHRLLGELDSPRRVLCDCGKWITLTKAGAFRHHNNGERDPLSLRWKVHCRWSGRTPEDQAAAHIRDLGAIGHEE